jgi:hypothetical protein
MPGKYYGNVFIFSKTACGIFLKKHFRENFRKKFRKNSRNFFWNFRNAISRHIGNGMSNG